MLKYAKIIDENTKQCSVGVGTNTDFYKSLGMTLQDVEEAYDGNWYLTGYVPEKSQEFINQQRIAKLQQYLNDTDWYVIRYSETGVEIPKEIKQKRQEARKEINILIGGTQNETISEESSINSYRETADLMV